MTRYLSLLTATGLAGAQVSGPEVRVYKTAGTTKLTAHLFRPVGSDREPVVLQSYFSTVAAGSRGLRNGSTMPPKDMPDTAP